MSGFDAKRSRAKRPLPLWVDAFQRDTTMLETDEIGAYLKLLMAMWSSRDVALPDDPRKLSRVAGVSLRLWNSRIWPSLESFFSSCDEGITQQRLRKEAAYVQRQVTNQSNRKSPEKSGKPLKDNNTGSTADTTADPSAAHPSQQPNNLHIAAADESRAREPEIPPTENPTFREKILRALDVDPVSGLTGHGGGMLGTRVDMIEAERWLTELELTEDDCVAVVREISTRRQGRDPPKRFSYFTGAMRDLASARAKPALTVIPAGETSSETHHRKIRASDDAVIAEVAARFQAQASTD